MAAFLWAVNHWIDMIEWNYQQLSEARVEDPVMKAFPINCSSCSKFGCRMGGICTTFPNPLQFVEDPPSGYEEDFWDPLRGNLEKADNMIQRDSSGKLEIVKKPAGVADPAPIKPKEKEDFSMFMPKE